MNPGNAWRTGAGDPAAANVACGSFLARHSAYLDGDLTPAERAAHEAHEARCASCARYAAVLRRGSNVLRELPEISPSTDFHERLQHRLYHVRDEAALAPLRTRRASWLAAAAGFALIAGGTVVVELREAAKPSQAGAASEYHIFQLADSWTTPAVPATAPAAPIPAFTGYTPVVVRRPLYQPVTYELLAGE
jgi:anti-sigma factor RsiW